MSIKSPQLNGYAIQNPIKLYKMLLKYILICNLLHFALSEDIPIICASATTVSDPIAIQGLQAEKYACDVKYQNCLDKAIAKFGKRIREHNPACDLKEATNALIEKYLGVKISIT
ncbi:hypothetical protein FF38_13533 [Lucilia cuprina]|uniref:Uncharacterized protein n=1 Tax=Lucilia cuprina TaxID=7375 RepID=A0A0L0BPW0_LUCCU|nr:hypothetical protein CVS40_7926 [Lucilia cuprina]KNC22097.1 hypothetical protein FF38_13533 [Lucilia cuprina]